MAKASVISRLPTNRNFFLPVQAELVVSRLPGVEFFCQSVTLPGVGLPSVDQPNPLVVIPHAGDHLEFNEFSTTFKVDEYLENYISIFDWIVKLGFPTRSEEYFEIAGDVKKNEMGMRKDTEASLLFADSKGKVKTEAVFSGAFPVTLTDIVVDTTAQDTTYLTATARWRYIKYTMKRTT